MAITISQSDVEAVWGVINVAQWSSFGQGANSSTDTARVARACALGQAYINGRLGNSPYSIPLTSVDPSTPPPEIVELMAIYAGWWLYKTRGLNYAQETIKWVEGIYAKMQMQITQILTGSYPLYGSLAANTNRRQTPMVI